jgi:plastocyanin
VRQCSWKVSRENPEAAARAGAQKELDQMTHLRLSNMRLRTLTSFSAAMIMAACGGDKKSTTDSAQTATTPTPANATTSQPAPNPGEPAAAISGQTVEVKMLQDDKGNYRFDPAEVSIKSGDGVKFIMVSGGPHNVAFDPAQIPADAKSQLSANMPQQVSELSSPMMMNPNETYTISFGKMPAGKYEYHCTPHLAMGMKGTITVQ